MIYASDLDQTLIYSPRSAGVELPSPLLLPAETVNGEVRSYISARAFDLLREIAPRLAFVPVTTRTIEQYSRIELLRDAAVRPAYAIASNGGTILKDGEPDRDWSAGVRDRLRREAAPAADVKRLFDRIASSEWIFGERFCDELFYAYVINRQAMPAADVERTAADIRRLGWEVSIQGRKIYLVPGPVSKRAALAHVRERLGARTVIASGDSLLDRGFLTAAEYPIAPRHGELFREETRQPGTLPFAFTAQSGAFAADEIVAYARSICESERGSLSR